MLAYAFLMHYKNFHPSKKMLRIKNGVTKYVQFQKNSYWGKILLGKRASFNFKYTGQQF